MQDFQLRQKQLTDFIRDPAGAAEPGGIEFRRLKIYQDLFFNNFENFLSSAFPVCRSLFSEADWLVLVRQFICEHRCDSPYFLSIAEAFLQFLDSAELTIPAPAFFRDLAHYEWVELVLDIEDWEFPGPQTLINSPEELLERVLQLSPLAQSLVYQYPVHLLGENYQPSVPTGEPTCLVVYRNRQQQVKFMEINLLTARLLQGFEAPAGQSSEQLLVRFADQLGQPLEALRDFAVGLFAQLYQADILIDSEWV